MSEKLTANGTIPLTGMSAAWAVKYLPCEFIQSGTNRRMRIFDRDTVIEFMRKRREAKQGKSEAAAA